VFSQVDHANCVITQFRDIESLAVYIDRKMINPTLDIPQGILYSTARATVDSAPAARDEKNNATPSIIELDTLTTMALSFRVRLDERRQ